MLSTLLRGTDIFRDDRRQWVSSDGYDALEAARGVNMGATKGAVQEVMAPR